MSDFLTELRAEVLDAHAARRRRWSGRRLGFRPRLAPAAATAVAALVAAALALRIAAPPPTASPRVVDRIQLGGAPTDAVAARGSVWIADSTGRRVVELRSADRRVVARAPVRGQPVAVTGGPGGVWVRTAVGKGGAVAPVDGAPSARVGYGTALAAGSRSVWAADVELPPEGIHRIDAATTRDRGLVEIPGVYALAAGGGALWAVTNNGTVLRLDGRTARVRARWPALASSAGTAPPVLAADARGAWVLRTAQGADSQAIRLEGDRVIRRLPIDPLVVPLLAHAPDGLWVVRTHPLRGRSEALRLDPGSGRVTARVGLGDANVTALVPTGDELWVIAGDGSIAVVGE